MPWDLLQNSSLYYVASSSGSPLPHLLDGHRKLVGSSAIPARSCPGPVRYLWGSIVELQVPPDELPGLMTLHPHNTNVLQSITYAKSPYPPDRFNPGQKNKCFQHEYASPSRAVRVSHRYIVTVTVADFERFRRVWALPSSLSAPARDGHEIPSIDSSLGAPADFGRSR